MSVFLKEVKGILERTDNYVNYALEHSWFFLVTKFDLVMPAREALLRDIDTVKQSLINTHYQVELGNELIFRILEFAE